MFSIHEVLGLAVKLEKNGEGFYRGALSRFSEPGLTSLLGWLADEELRHMEWFSAKRSSLRPVQEESDMERMGDKLLREILGDQTFSLKEVDLSSIRDSKTLLEVAIEFEKDTVLFYEMICSLIGDSETTCRLEEIIEQERSHIASLQSLCPGENESAPV
jgi:rubrerythrin